MLHHRFVGSGKTVVFLHGFLESSTMWDVFPLEQFGFRCLLIDLPGHGNSPLGSNACSIAAMADAVLDTLERLEVQEYELIGHSLGAYVALQIHEQTKSSGKLCLFHSNFWEDDEQKKNDRNRVINLVQTNKSLFIKEAIPNLFIEKEQQHEFIQGLIAEALQMTPDAIACHARAMRDRRSKEAYVLSIREQIMIIQGENDKIVPAEIMIRYSDKLPISLIPSAGHMGHVENPNLSFIEIQSFFS